MSSNLTVTVKLDNAVSVQLDDFCGRAELLAKECIFLQRRIEDLLGELWNLGRSLRGNKFSAVP